MTELRSLLDDVASLPEVVGCFAVRAGQVAERSIPATFKNARLQALARELASMHLATGQARLPAALLSLDFERGRVLYYPVSEQVYRYMVPIRVKKACLSCHGEPAGEIDISGYPKEGYKEGEIRGAISVVAPMDEAIRKMRRNLFVLGLSGLAFCLLAVGSVQVLVRRLVSDPIARLVGIADAVSMGDFDTPIDIVSTDEVGQLARALARMRNSLRKSIEMLREKG